MKNGSSASFSEKGGGFQIIEEADMKNGQEEAKRRMHGGRKRKVEKHWRVGGQKKEGWIV